jgi:hypothetical protein
MHPILFLDIDGVLVPDGEDIHHHPQFHPRCVNALKSILIAVPNLRIVFCTTWRLTRHVNRLHEQWNANGLPGDLPIDGTPDLREDLNTPRLYRRGHEIKAWLDAHPNVTRWVVLDDERLAIEPVLGSEQCVFTNPARGLTPENAERAIEILSSF